MVGGISVWQLLILLLIVVLVFGTKRLRNLGSDLGSAVRGFRRGMEDDSEEETTDSDPQRLESGSEDSGTAGTSDKDDEHRARSSGSDV